MRYYTCLTTPFSQGSNQPMYRGMMPTGSRATTYLLNAPRIACKQLKIAPTTSNLKDLELILRRTCCSSCPKSRKRTCHRPRADYDASHLWLPQCSKLRFLKAFAFGVGATPKPFRHASFLLRKSMPSCRHASKSSEKQPAWA